MKIRIADRTLCRAENAFTFKEKIEIARQLYKLNVDVIELSEIVNVKADTLLVKTISSFVKDSVLSVATGLSVEGVNNAAEAIGGAKKPRLRIEAPVSTVGMEYVCHKKAPAMLELVKKLIVAAKEKIDDVELCLLDATRAEKDVITEMISVAKENGVSTITLCDNAAEMLPDEFSAFVKEMTDSINDTDISVGVMCENKNGLAAANTVMSIKNGVNTIKTDIDGTISSVMTIGSIIKNAGQNYGFESTLKLTELNRIYNQINWIIGNSKNQKNIVSSADADNNEVLLSNKDTAQTVSSAVYKLGYDLSEEDNAKVYEEFLRVTEKKNVTVKELDAIVASVALQVPTTYKLISYLVNNGNIISATAQITLEMDGKELQGVSIGDGPIDAAFLAIEQIIGHRYELDDFQIQSVTEGTEAMGSAVVKLRSGGKLYSGNGISTDIIGAAIKAYLAAVNKIVYEEVNI
ncbi:MAG: alpha-isopropylmalate synthase regulatory domain-containing protein [Acutalibacteraceae bacterium]|nr:alpha-isopropylmalate synthase regulatory domain-containing protein [Acutalibacteraceae bacterium]